jgi:hypothetical protein
MIARGVIVDGGLDQSAEADAPPDDRGPMRQ